MELPQNRSDIKQTNRVNKTDNDSLVKDDCYNSEDFNEKQSIEDNDDQVFCFETDHAALKGNADYHNLIKALAMLQAQRIKVVEDIGKLENLYRKVKNNPREYVNKIVRGESLDIPSRIDVQQVPKIDWSKYSTKDYRGGTSSTTTSTYTLPEKGVVKEHETIKSTEDSNALTVRGRVYDQTKPQTFNQLWTAEEQLRLEELLLEYPPELNENNRWRKIAQALGNRTTKQVCSRVQKYFKKLSKAGLPIPGHQLKTNNMTSTKKKPRRSQKKMVRKSTFFPTQHLGAPHLLDGLDEDENKSRVPDLTPELKASIVKKVIEFKKKDETLPPFSHPGVKCNVCGETPLQGTRWRCLMCRSVNLCSDCVVSQLNVEVADAQHPASHPLEPLANPSLAHWDPDYMPDSFQSTNYLDPNFVTANVL